MTIFHSRTYFDLHAGTHYLQSGSSVLPIWTVGGTSHSPLRGTFAGPSSGSLKDLERVVDMAIDLRGQFHFKLAPAGHDEAHFAQAVNVLLRKGFKITRHDLNYEARIAGAACLELRMDRGQVKHLHAAERLGWHVEPCAFNGQVYDVIADNRKRKGRSLSMSYDAVKAMADTFPEDVICFCIPRKAYLATAICLRLSPDILYVYAWGDMEGAEHSPCVLLACGIYDWCAMNGVKLMDIGTATEDGVPNEGLIAFKTRLGFSPSLKVTMSRY